jgi:hypothetical protein
MDAFGKLMLHRWKVAATTAALVAGVLVIRLAVDALSWEFVTPGPLLTSIIAGAIFVTGLIVAGTLADYKESERMPAEITAALDNIHEDARSIAATEPEFDLAGLQTLLRNIVATFRQDLAQSGSRACLEAINALSAPFLALERLGVPANYIVRLRAEQGSVRRNVLRIYHIQKTEFLPSAYILIQSIVTLIIGVLVFAKIEPGYEAVVLLLMISYFFIYLVMLLKILDTPFRVRQHTMDDVSLFLLKEFSAGLGNVGHA